MFLVARPVLNWYERATKTNLRASNLKFHKNCVWLDKPKPNSREKLTDCIFRKKIKYKNTIQEED